MIVILTEKPSVAIDIASAIGKFKKENGYVTVDNYIITWAYGHLFDIDDSIAPKKWSLNDLPIFPEKFVLKVKENGASKQYKIIKSVFSKAKECYIATDAGPEGELIAREILYNLSWKGQIKRLWTSEALTKDVINRELKNLKDISNFDGIYYAALSRQHSDWLIGINFTRLITLIKNNKQVWSVGRVQTPTLKMIVSRDKEIENFIPIPYGIVKSTFEIKTGEKYIGTLINDNDKKFTPEEAKKLCEIIKTKTEAQVLKVKKEEKKESPPLLHSLTTLQREANSIFGYSAKKTLDIAQGLYETKKCISYPRTDSQHLANSSKSLVINILRKLDKQEFIEKVNTLGKRIFDDSKLTDHHALIPLDKEKNDFTVEEKNIYQLIYKRFISIFMPDYIYEAQEIITGVNNFKFSSKGRIEKQIGWRKLYKIKNKEQILPSVKQGETVKLIDTIWEEKKTEPPARYTEGTLLKEMEKLRLGTPATRAMIIDRLKQVKYIELNEKKLTSTNKGRELIETIKESQIASPNMTAEWEKQLIEIQKLNKNIESYKKFISNIKEFIKKEHEKKNLNIYCKNS